MIRNTFNIEKHFDVFTLGDILQLLYIINERIKVENSFEVDVTRRFKRNYIVDAKDLKYLDDLSGARTQVTGVHTTKRK